MRTEIAAEYIRKRDDGIYEYVAINGDDEIIIAKPVNFEYASPRVKRECLIGQVLEKNMAKLRDAEDILQWLKTELDISITNEICSIVKAICSFCNKNNEYWGIYPEYFDVPLPNVSICLFVILVDGISRNMKLINPKLFLDFVNDSISYEIGYQFSNFPQRNLSDKKYYAVKAVAERINSIFLNDKSDERNV